MFFVCVVGIRRGARLLSHKVVHVIPIVVHTSTTSAAKQVLEEKNSILGVRNRDRIQLDVKDMSPYHVQVNTVNI